MKSPRLIAVLWLLVLIKPLINLAAGAPLVTFGINFDWGGAAAAARPADVLTSQMNDSTSAVLALIERPFARRSGLDFELMQVSHVLVAAWLCGIVFFAGRALRSTRRLEQLIATSHDPSTLVRSRVSRIARELGLHTVPEVRAIHGVQVPAIVGTINPIILLPEWMLEGKHGQLLDWSLRHELTHWRFGDTLANGLRQLAHAVFSIHPAVRWAGRKWQQTAELACDRALVGNSADGRPHAEALYQLLARATHARWVGIRPGLHAARTQIGRRSGASKRLCETWSGWVM